MIHTQRKAFSMLTAIVVIVTMAVIAAYVTSTAGKSIKITTDQYRTEQAMFLAKSYTEYAIMAVSADAREGAAGSDTCLRDINSDVLKGIGTAANPNSGYQVRVRLFYIGSGAIVDSCAGTRVLSNAVAENTTPLNIIVDVHVRYRDLNDMNKVLTYHKRSLQKI